MAESILNGGEQQQQGAVQNDGATQQTWYDSLGLTDEYKGLIQTKNFKDANDLVKSYENLEKHMGADKNDIIRIPKAKDGEDPDYSEVFKALGRPEAATEYGLPDTDFGKAAAEEMFKLGLSTKQAKALSEWVDGYNKTSSEGAVAAAEKRSAEKLAALKSDWGADYDEKINTAKTTMADLAKEFGFGESEIYAFEDAFGIDVAAKILLRLADKNLGDSTQRMGDYSSKAGNETPEMAQFRLKEMYSDPETAKKLASGDPKIHAELNRLNAIVAKAKFNGGNK